MVKEFVGKSLRFRATEAIRANLGWDSETLIRDAAVSQLMLDGVAPDTAADAVEQAWNERFKVYGW